MGVRRHSKHDVAAAIQLRYLRPVKGKSVQERYLAKTPPSRRGNHVLLDTMKIGHPLPTAATVPAKGPVGERGARG